MRSLHRLIRLYLLSTVIFFLSPGLRASSIVEINSGSTENPVFDLVQADPALKSFYDDCSTRHSIDKDKIPDCLWTNVKDNPTLKKKVIQAMESKKNNSSENSNDKEIMAKKNKIKIDESNDPYIKKLNEHISKQLENIFLSQSGRTHDEKGNLIDDKKRKTYLATDHAKFAELYNTQLANSVTQALSSYCSEAVEDSRFTFTQSIAATSENNTNQTQQTPRARKLFIIKSNADSMKNDQKNNLQSLNNADFKPKNCNDPAEESSTYCSFNRCIDNIKEVCYNTNISYQTSSTSESEDLKYSRSRACVVMDFIKNARAGIMAMDKQKDFYNNISRNQALSIDLSHTGLKEFKSDGDIKRGSQDITAITSGELQKIAEESKAEIESLKCIDENGNRNNEICKQLVLKDRENAEKSLLEFGMRRIAQVDDIENIQNEEDLKKFLVSEGDSEDKAKEFIQNQLSANNGSLTDVIQKIKNKYKVENDAIIKSLSDKIENHSIDLSDQSPQNNNKLKNIQNELQSKGARYANIIQFGNIVSAYLSIKDQRSGEIKTNTAQIYRELASSQNVPVSNNQANQEQPLINAETVKNNVKSAGLKESKSDDDQVSLKVKDINEILGK